MNPIEIIERYYDRDSRLYRILVNHSIAVTQKALKIAKDHPELNIDIKFIEEAAMLHDIGIFKTNAPRIECHGQYPYIAHGYLGAEILRNEGFKKHAFVCERHTGAGLNLDEIVEKKLPLPHINMMPISIEEQVICFADCFYSKSKINDEKTIETIEDNLSRFGERSVIQFKEWCDLFL